MNCPTHEQLRQAALGLLADDALDAIEQHFTDCAACETVVGHLSATDPLVESLRRQPLVDTEKPPSTEMDSLIDRMRAVVTRVRQDATATGSNIDPTVDLADPHRTVPRASDDQAAREPFPCLAAPQSGDEIGRLGGY